jgi:hypothetical protein
VVSGSQVTHADPPVPHAASLGVTHTPVAEQQPMGQSVQPMLIGTFSSTVTGVSTPLRMDAVAVPSTVSMPPTRPSTPTPMVIPARVSGRRTRTTTVSGSIPSATSGRV